MDEHVQDFRRYKRKREVDQQEDILVQHPESSRQQKRKFDDQQQEGSRRDANARRARASHSRSRSLSAERYGIESRDRVVQDTSNRDHRDRVVHNTCNRGRVDNRDRILRNTCNRGHVDNQQSPSKDAWVHEKLPWPQNGEWAANVRTNSTAWEHTDRRPVRGPIQDRNWIPQVSRPHDNYNRTGPLPSRQYFVVAR